MAAIRLIKAGKVVIYIKVESKKEDRFKPFSIVVRCETQEEADVLGSLFNCTPVASALRQYGNFDPAKIAEELARNGAVIGRWTLAISQHIKSYKPY